jgi:dipeptidyl aminopeptidase/acylaminoacyl peptidase
MNRTLRAGATALLVLLAVAPSARADLPPLISRDLLFGNPERTNPQLSPDGKRLAWLAADATGVMQVWVQTIGKEDAHAVTADAKRPVRIYFWAEDDKTLLYQQDQGGDENFHVYGVDLDTGNVRDYTPWQGVRAQVIGGNPRFKNQILVEMNARKRETMDVYRVDLSTGAVTFDTENPGDVNAWVVDDNMVVRGAFAIRPDGDKEIRVRDSQKGKWRVLLAIAAEDETFPYDFSKDGKTIYLTSTAAGDTAQLIGKNVKTGKETVLAASDVVDVGDVLINPYTHVIEAVAFDAGKPEWKVLDKRVQADLDGIAKLESGAPTVLSRTRADDVWLVMIDHDDSSPHFWRWDRKARKGEFMFSQRPKLDEVKLAPMAPIEYKARDGLTIHAYLTLPVGVPAKKLPLVLLVHGGPWSRDTWGFKSLTQLLANRGYAVLQPNFRGSTGFGKKFLHAGDRQWGLAMQDDLTDGVKWAVEQGYADPKRLAIMGGSYGGYAALAGATFTPELYRCAVDVVGPSSLFTLLASVPPYWKPLVSMFHLRMGDPEKDKDLLTKASPLFSADKIKIPLLIGQGANDPRVNQQESEQIVAAIEKNKGRVIYVLYSDEGHGFKRPENMLDFTARSEAFLAESLGGRVEPLKGDKYPGSTAVVKVVGGKPKKK